MKNLAEVQILRTVWAQQFREAQGKMVYQELKTYEGRTQIQTAHDPEARYSKKRYQEWVGDKVQVTETDDEDHLHIITDVVGTQINRTDYEELAAIQARLQGRKCLPKEQYVDAGYISGPNLANSRAQNIELIGPLPPVVTPQDCIPNRLTQAYFQVDPARQIVTCPQGHAVGNPTSMRNTLVFHFPKNYVPTVIYDRVVAPARAEGRSASKPSRNSPGCALTTKNRNVPARLP